MAAIDMSILKFYNKMHPTSFFFSHLKRYKTYYCETFRLFSKSRVYQCRMFFQSLLTIH